MDLNSHYPCEGDPEPWRLFAKKEYNEKVKTNQHEIELQNKPFDNDIRNPKLNFFLPHYNHLGYDPEKRWTTTTATMLKQPFTERAIPNPNKKFLSYYTFKETLHCPRPGNACKQLPFTVNDYVTTMQNSYRPIPGSKIERLEMKDAPFLQNRRFLIETPESSSNKFWDEDNMQEIKLLHKHKPNRQRSYNFMTGLHSDGTPVTKTYYTIV